LVIHTLLALALQDPQPPVARREEVVVVADRAPERVDEVAAAVTVLDRERLDGLPAQSLDEALRDVTGLQVLFGSGLTGLPFVSSRGFFGGGEAEYVLLLVDGIAVRDVESGLVDWRRIRVADVERVEVLHGPGSSLYGDTALGGVVSVTTRAAAGEEGGAVSASGGGFETGALDASWRGRVGSSRLAVSGNGWRTDGAREHAASRELAADATLAGSIGGRAWRVGAAGSARDRDDPGPLATDVADRGSSDPLYADDHDRTDRGRAAFSLRQEGTLAWHATLAASARDTDQVRTLLFAPGLGDTARRDLSTTSLDAAFDVDRRLAWRGRALHLRAGVSGVRDAIDTEYRALDAAGPPTARAEGTRRRWATYVAQDLRPTDRLRNSAGLRWDAIDDDLGGAVAVGGHRAWSPRLGVNYRLGSGPVVLFAQASRAFKAATLDQVLDPRPFPDFAGGTFTVSNPTLAPQRARTLEAGAWRQGGRLTGQVTAYLTDVRDEIDFDPATFRYVNIGSSRHAGLEARLAVNRGAVAPYATYAWSHVASRETGRADFQLKNIPRHLARVGVRAQAGATRAELAATRLAGRFLDDEGAFPLADVTTLDLRLQHAVGARLSAHLDLLNLTDRTYDEMGFVLSDFEGQPVTYSYPAAGFTARMGLRFQF
jgi:outer membrane cobalamin receptor